MINIQILSLDDRCFFYEMFFKNSIFRLLLNSRNQLTTLPREVCRLPLQILLVAYNRLTALPEELGRMSSLAELDAGCNEIVSLPPRIGDLPRLRCLDLRSNFLVHLPIGLSVSCCIMYKVASNAMRIRFSVAHGNVIFFAINIPAKRELNVFYRTDVPETR